MDLKVKTPEVLSKNKKIRLTEERWKHIILMHPNLSTKQKKVLNTIRNPEGIIKGRKGELLAISKLSIGSYLVVIYKENGNDGFIITAYDTTDTKWLFKKELIWSKHS